MSKLLILLLFLGACSPSRNAQGGFWGPVHVWKRVTAHNGGSQKRGDPKLFYWTIWFTVSNYPSDFDTTGKGNKWVQSFSDPYKASDCYHSLKSTGTVIIWGKYSCKVNPETVYIDSFNMVTRKYSFESH